MSIAIADDLIMLYSAYVTVNGVTIDTIRASSTNNVYSPSASTTKGSANRLSRHTAVGSHIVDERT
jgi:hypothetical protein